jgi:hypothetical protein
MVLMRHGTAESRQIVVDGPVPNPVSAGKAGFEIYLMSDSQVAVKIYDARGSLIDSESTGRLNATGPPEDEAARPHPWEWDPYRGRRPASGVYWLEFAPDTGGRTVKKITLLH